VVPISRKRANDPMRDLDDRRVHVFARSSIAALVVCAGGGAAAVACLSNDVPPAADASTAPDATMPEGGGVDSGGPPADAGTVTIARTGGPPISPFAFGHNYWDWVDWAGDGVTGASAQTAGDAHPDSRFAGGRDARASIHAGSRRRRSRPGDDRVKTIARVRVGGRARQSCGRGAPTRLEAGPVTPARRGRSTRAARARGHPRAPAFVR
jgi:hypothetical protein